MRRGALLTVLGVSAVLAAPAGAAVQVGETFPPTSAGGTCIEGRTVLQAGSPGAKYAAPIPGVITAWSHHAAALTETFPNPVDSLKLKVARPVGGDNFRIIGDSPLEEVNPGRLNTYTDVRIPVRAGDVIGAYLADDGYCVRSTTTGYTWLEEEGDPAPGTTKAFTGPSDQQLDIAARLERDSDNDGLGDETQDECPTEPGPERGCDPPETTITKKPKNKTRKRRAKFRFGSDESGSFECSLDAGPFSACDSPYKKKVKRRKHTFAVRAIDSAGSIDETPATDSWKVKKRKK
jgi:hypothetical protein